MEGSRFAALLRVNCAVQYIIQAYVQSVVANPALQLALEINASNFPALLLIARTKYTHRKLLNDILHSTVDAG